MQTITVEIPIASAHAIAGLLDSQASERRTASGAVARPGKGVEYAWRESFRETLYAIADQIRRAADMADAARDAERYGPAVRPMQTAGEGS